jgi:transposase
MDILHLNIGVDVSKDTLDVAYIDARGKAVAFQVANDKTGFAKMAGKLENVAPLQAWHIALEATSAYHRAFVMDMFERDVLVLVLNPKQARDLARGLGVLRKNDKTDAGVLALCAKMAWRKPEAIASGAGYRLQELSRRIDVLTRRRAGEKKRLLKPGVCELVQDSCRRQIALIDDELTLLEQQWKQELEGSAELKLAYLNVRTVPGCGEVTARKVVSELLVAPRARTTAQCVAYAGLAPHEQTSGTSLRRKASTFSAGNKFLRTALYMGAVSAIRSDHLSRELYLRLTSKGKPKKVAIVAVMGKTMRRIAAVVNRGTPWVRD